MLDNYSSPSTRESIVSSIKETLIKFIKTNEELNVNLLMNETLNDISLVLIDFNAN